MLKVQLSRHRTQDYIKFYHKTHTLIYYNNVSHHTYTTQANRVLGWRPANQQPSEDELRGISLT